jgi:hypothetical protein
MIYEKAGTLRISVQDPAKAGQVVKNVQGAKVALESLVGVNEGRSGILWIMEN